MLPPPTTELRLIAGEAWQYDFGRIFDFEGDNVSVSIDLGNAESFIFFEEEFMRISVGAGETDKQTQPVFDVTLTLTDDHYFDPLS